MLNEAFVIQLGNGASWGRPECDRMQGYQPKECRPESRLSLVRYHTRDIQNMTDSHFDIGNIHELASILIRPC